MASAVEDKTHAKEYYQCERPEMLSYIPSGIRRVLDAGCGEGNFGASVKALRNVEVWGIEKDPGAAASAGKSLDRVLIGDLEEALGQLPEAYFDCVIFNDILEHLTDPWSVLRTARTKLSPSGTVVASIPNVRFWGNVANLLMRSDWTYIDSGILDWTHLRFFTHKTIRAMFESCGYELVEIAGINPSKSWKFELLRLLTAGRVWDMQFPQFACVARAQKPA